MKGRRYVPLASDPNCEAARQRRQRMRSISQAVSNARKKHVTVGRRKQWTCNVCAHEVKVKASSMRALTLGRYGHIKRVHPKLPLDRFTDIRAYIPEVPTLLDTPRLAWMCAWCHQFLPKLETRYALSKSARAHLKRCEHAPKAATLMHNLRQILVGEGLTIPARNADVCQLFGRKIQLETYRPSAGELRALTSEQDRSASPQVRRALASRECVMHSGHPPVSRKRNGSPDRHRPSPAPSTVPRPAGSALH